MRRTTPLQWLVLSAALFMLAAPTVASARAWLGVYTQEVTGDLREGLDLPDHGVLVARVVPGSPADRAGLRSGDVILAVDTRDVNSPAELSEVIGNAREGESAAITFVREGSRRTLAIRLATRPSDDEMGGSDDEVAPPAPPAPGAPHAAPAPPAPGDEMRWYSDNGPDREEIRRQVRRGMPDLENLGRSLSMAMGRGRLGVRIQDLSEDMASALGASGSKGALVLEVLDDTPAEKAGLRAGDIITAVEGKKVADADDLTSALRDESGKVSLTVVRRGQSRTVEAELAESPRVIRLRDGQTFMGPGRMGDEGKPGVRSKGNADDEDLRQQLQQLREEVRALRREIQDRR
jgi:C-terminal processing protease CtpA/Prc